MDSSRTGGISLDENIEANLKVPGMRCGHCAAKIQSNLGKIDGVVNVKMDVSSRTVSVRYHEDVTSLDKIKRAIRMAGFMVD